MKKEYNLTEFCSEYFRVNNGVAVWSKRVKQREEESKIKRFEFLSI